MYMMVVKLLLPYIARYMANYVAQYLENRQTESSEIQGNTPRPIECPPCPPATTPAAGSANTVWYSLSGILLGGALGTILYVFWQDINRESESELLSVTQ